MHDEMVIKLYQHSCNTAALDMQQSVTLGVLLGDSESDSSSSFFLLLKGSFIHDLDFFANPSFLQVKVKRLETTST